MPGDQCADLELKALNKGSAKTASFKVRILHGRTVTWEHDSKYTGEKKKGCKYEVILVGEDPKYYLKASVKAKNEQEANKVGAKFVDATAWRLSKVALDTHTPSKYLHTPIKLHVDLEKAKMMPILQGTPDEQSLSRSLQPSASVASIAAVKSSLATDVLGVVRDIGERRHPPSLPPVADVTLADGSSVQDKQAEIKIAVWGERNLDFIAAHRETALMFLNVMVTKVTNGLKVSFFKDEMVCEGAEDALVQSKDAITGATEVEKLTTDFVPTAKIETAGPQVMTCAAILNATAEATELEMPEVLQVNFVRIDEPTTGQEVWEKTPYKVIVCEHCAGLQRSSFTVRVREGCAAIEWADLGRGVRTGACSGWP